MKKWCFSQLILPSGILILCFLFNPTNIYAQKSGTATVMSQFGPGVLRIAAMATGRTTGHIADLNIENTSDQHINLEIPAFEIPPTPADLEQGLGERQGFIVPDPITIDIPPGATVEMPLTGYCTNPYLTTLVPPAMLPPHVLWVYDPPILEQFNSIRTVVTKLQNHGVINTPFSNNRNQERDIIIQQTLWWWSVGPSYDPCEHIRQSFVSTLNESDTGYPADTNIEEGIAQIQDAMIKVDQTINPPTTYWPDNLPEIQTPVTETDKTKEPSQFKGRTTPHIIELTQATGTGRTTGHIADLIIQNPSEDPIVVDIGDGRALYIPSNGNEQSYVVPPIPRIPVGSRETVSVPVIGYCADIHRPPVGNGDPMPPVSEWINRNPEDTPILPSSSPTTPIDPKVPLVYIPVSTAPPISEVIEYLDQLPTGVPSDWDCPKLPPGTQALIPGTNTYIKTPIEKDIHPSLAAPLLIDALERIVSTAGRMMDEGSIRTPFSNQASKEKEAVIQQTFWMYSAHLDGTPYVKEDFKLKTEEQFETSTGKPVSSLPPAQLEQIDKGVDEFWNTFQAVGVAAKVLPEVPVLPEPAPIPQEVFNVKRPLRTTSSTDIPRSPTTGPVDNPPPPIPPLPPLPPVPPDENTCQPTMMMNSSPAMDGGLNKGSVGTFLIRYNDLLPLVAEGADADEIEFWCTPYSGCPETKSYRKEGLTSRVKYRWEMIDGPGHFVRSGKDTSTTSEDKVVLWQPPNLTGTEESTVSIVTTRIRLTILDDLPGQPQDDPVVQMIEITTTKDQSRHFDSIRVEVKGPVFSTYKQPVPVVETGTCMADPLKWSRTDDLKPNLAQAHGDLVFSGQKIILRANDKRDPDELSLTCTSTCDPSAFNISLEDEVLFDWRIIGPSDIFGSFLEGQGISTANTWGREVVYQAPVMKSGDLRRNVMIEVLAYNQPTYPFLYERSPALSKAVDLILRDTIVLDVDCRPPGFRPHAEVVIGWTDHLLDHDHPWIVETLHHVSKSVNLFIVPDECEPTHNKNPETDQSTVDGAVIIEPISNDHNPQTDDSYIEQTVVVSHGNVFILHNYLIIIDDGFLSRPTDAQWDDFFAFVEELLGRLIDWFLINRFESYAGNSSDQPFYNELSDFMSEIFSTGDISDNNPFFRQMIKYYMDKNPGGSEAAAREALRADIPYRGMGWQNHDMVKKYEFGLLYSWWSVISHRTNCLESCPVLVDHFTWSSLGDTDHYYKRDSKILVITPAGVQAKTYSHENKGPDFD